MTNVKTNLPQTSLVSKTANIISETRRPDGSLATQILRIGFDKYLIQYDSQGQVVFKEQMGELFFNEKDITYNNGCVASITRRDYRGNRAISQYDENGHIIATINANKNDIVNFAPSGYVRSVIKHLSEYGDFGKTTEIEEITFNDFGHIVSSAHKVKMTDLFGPGRDKWMTTDTKQYYPNGQMASHITYKQKTKRTGRWTSENQEDEAASYISSITQYSEKGKLQVSAQLGEYDEINFNGDKVACITRRVKKGDSLETMSQTTYYPSGNLCTITTYQDGKVVSSVTYDEQGKPQSSAQQGTENYQDIYQNAQQTRQNTQNIKSFAKIGMTPQQAASILGVSLSATEQEVKVAYRKLCKIWHPDRNQGNEEVAKRKMQQINEAYSVMSQYIRNRGGQSRPEQPQQPRPEHINRMQQAWNKLQQAIRDYDYAVDRLKAATAEKERIRSEYVRTAANDQKKRKLEQQLRKAEIAWSACVNNKIRAQAYKDKCEREYNMLRMQKYTKMYQQKCCEYQRAA